MRKNIKKIFCISFSLILGLLSAVPAFADEEYSYEETSVYEENFEETSLFDEKSSEILSSDENEDEMMTEIEDALEESETEENTEEISSVPAEETTAEAVLSAPVTSDDETVTPYTTIYVSGLTMNYTMVIKNNETGEKYKLAINEDNDWTTTFDGPEGTYRIVKFETESNSVKAGKVYNKNNEEIKNITIKRTDNWQQLEITVTEHVTFAVFKILKEHWFLTVALIVLGIAYIYLRKNRVLPSEER